MNIAIVGSRNYKDLIEVRRFVRDLPLDTCIVSGGARGVDSVAESEAKICGLKTIIFLPDWHKHGRSAGFIRNKQIVATSDLVVAFWDGQSAGTRSSIKLAEEMGKGLLIF